METKITETHSEYQRWTKWKEDWSQNILYITLDVFTFYLHVVCKEHTRLGRNTEQYVVCQCSYLILYTLYRKLNMLHTKISNKLCDFGLVYLLIITRTCMHVFKHCDTNLPYYLCISYMFWIIILAVPSSILYTITVEVERTLLHSTQVNT